jgi:hypothetical protein
MHLYTIPAWQLALGFMLLLALAVEVGHRGGRRSKHLDHEGLAIVQGAVIGVVGLLLAFSFTLASSRYDLRKELAVKEANAIDTLYRRAKLLPEPTRSGVRERLRSYVEARFEYFEAGIDVARIHHAEAETERLQNELWALLVRDADEEPEACLRRANAPAVRIQDATACVGASAVRLLLIAPAMNATFDTGEERNAAYENRVPQPALLLLTASLLLAGALVGYRPGIAKRHLLLWTAFCVLVTLVFFGVLDFDRPRRGLIQVTQEPILAIQEQMRAETP